LENSIFFNIQSFNYSIRFGFISWSKTYLTIKYWFERKCFKTRSIELHIKCFLRVKNEIFIWIFLNSNPKLFKRVWNQIQKYFLTFNLCMI
jgi:hypothetical protein